MALLIKMVSSLASGRVRGKLSGERLLQGFGPERNSSQILPQPVVQLVPDTAPLRGANLQQLLFQPPPFSNIACNYGGTRDLAGRIPNGGDCQRDPTREPSLFRRRVS